MRHYAALVRLSERAPNPALNQTGRYAASFFVAFGAARRLA